MKKNILCFILSLLMTLPSLCLTSCDSASVGDIGGLSTDETQRAEKNKTPYYTAPEKYKELAKSDKVYRSGIYTGYSVIIRNTITSEKGEFIGHNLNEVMLKYPGEAIPVHEDPTCSHDSDRCPTFGSMERTFLIVDTDSGLPIIFYFCLSFETVYSEEGEPIKSQKVGEVRGYDVETGEYTTVSKLALTKVDNAILYKGKMYITGVSGYRLGMVDIVTGESKIIENEGYDNDYNILDIVNDRLYYTYAFGEERTEENPVEKNEVTLRSCSLDLNDVRVEYDFGDLGEDLDRLSMNGHSYIDGGVLYLPKASRFAFDPREASPDVYTVYGKYDLKVYDIYALDLNNISAGEKLILKDAYKYEVKNGKLYYTLADYEEVGEVSTSVVAPEPYPPFIKMFASTDGGTLYEYDIATGATREVCRDSGYNIDTIYEVTDDGKLLFEGRDYVNFVRADEGNYADTGNVGRKEYCMVDLSTGNVTELYAPIRLEDVPE